MLLSSSVLNEIPSEMSFHIPLGNVSLLHFFQQPVTLQVSSICTSMSVGSQEASEVISPWEWMYEGMFVLVNVCI